MNIRHMTDITRRGFTFFKGEHHIRSAFKKAYIFFPTHTALTVLQTYKLLFHLSTALGTDFIVYAKRYHPKKVL